MTETEKVDQPITYEMLEPPVDEADVNSIYELLKAEPRYSKLDFDTVSANTEESVSSHERTLYVAKHAARIVGMASVIQEVIPEQRDAHIKGLHVPTPYVGLGVKRSLMTLIVEHADADEFWLHVTANGTLDRLLFQSLGFFSPANDKYFRRRPSA